MLKSSVRGDFHLFYAGPMAEHTGFGQGKPQGHLSGNWKDRVEAPGKGRPAAVQRTHRAWAEGMQNLGMDRRPMLPDLML